MKTKPFSDTEITSNNISKRLFLGYLILSCLSMLNCKSSIVSQIPNQFKTNLGVVSRKPTQYKPTQYKPTQYKLA